MKEQFYRRQFLNSEHHGGTAFLEASVNAGGQANIDAEFKVGDCNRIVTLDFSVWNKSDALNIRMKLRKMRLAFRAFERSLLEEIDKKYK